MPSLRLRVHRHPKRGAYGWPGCGARWSWNRSADIAQTDLDGVSESWVHGYQNRSTASLRASGATVNLVINDDRWSFAVAVDTVQTFAPDPFR